MKLFLEIFFGVCTSLPIALLIYDYTVKGRIRIKKDYLSIHNEKEKYRYKITVFNKGRRTIEDLICLITIHNLTQNDIVDESKRDLYLISQKNFIPIKNEYIIWDTYEKSVNLHPKQYIDIDILHYDKRKRTIEIPSEFGYTRTNKNHEIISKSRTLITNIKLYDAEITFYGKDYKSRKIKFRIIPNQNLDIQIMY